VKYAASVLSPPLTPRQQPLWLAVAAVAEPQKLVAAAAEPLWQAVAAVAEPLPPPLATGAHASQTASEALTSLEQALWQPVGVGEPRSLTHAAWPAAAHLAPQPPLAWQAPRHAPPSHLAIAR